MKKKENQILTFTMIVKYQWVLLGTFTLRFFFLAVDLWKIFIKIKLSQYSVPLFSTWSHILEVQGTLSQVFLGTSYLHHRRILSDERLLFFSIIVKFLFNFIQKVKKNSLWSRKLLGSIHYICIHAFPQKIKQTKF